MKWDSGVCCALVCIAFIAWVSVLAFRPVQLQVAQHEGYAEVAAEKHGDKQIIFAERGPILDAQGEVLAPHVPNETAVRDATPVRGPDTVAPAPDQQPDLEAAETR